MNINESIISFKNTLSSLQKRNAPKEDAEKEIRTCFETAFNEIKTDEEKKNTLQKIFSLGSP